MEVTFLTVAFPFAVLGAAYLVLRALIVDYFRLKEEFVERLQAKVTKGQLDGAGH